MLSRSSRGTVRWMTKAAAVVLLAFAAPVFSAEPDSNVIREADVNQAVETLKKDPDLATTRKMRTLRWIDSDKKQPKKMGWLKWIGELFGWFAQVSRVFIWLLIGLLIGLLVLYLLRFTKTFDKRSMSSHVVAPTHVRDLDIRPESLPDDVGMEAWSLWDRGEHRAALSLLYRGLLSRLAHTHQVPIRDSSTEGDCLLLSQRHLLPDRHQYVGSLIGTWQRAVYGGEDPQSPAMRALCEQFDSALRPVTADAERTA